MHRSGRKIPLQVIRDGKELPEIARLDPLSDAGASVHVDCKLLPGDTVKLRCAFDNPMNQVLRWGDDRYDEMCLVNFRYYPVTDLVFCADFVRGQTEMWALLSVCRRCAARIVSQDRQVAQAEASTESTLTTRAASRVPVLCLLAEGQGALRQDKTAPAEAALKDNGCSSQMGTCMLAPRLQGPDNGQVDTTSGSEGTLANGTYERTAPEDGALLARKLVVRALLMVFIQVLHLSDLDGWTISVRPGRTLRAKGALAAERRQQNSGGMHEGPAGLQLSHTAIRNDVLSDTASLQQLEKTVDIPQRVPTTHLIDWLAELDPAGFLKCYLPILLTMGHRTARDVVHKYVEKRPGETPQLAEQLFTDLQVQKLGHRRLFERWFAGLLRAPIPS
ncbi:unnamed protein product [Symbiodinium sp. KB8]|nr:unnamed protein product [Symbiodinium sp. KB8]